MNKKTGFLLGLLLGGAAAVVAFKRLDPVKRQKLVNNLNQKASNLKDKAVDYAFYASDAMNDASGQLKKGANGAATHAKSALNSAQQHAGQLKQQVSNHFSHDAQDQEPSHNTQFHTAADHLRSELNGGAKSDNDIVIDATQNFQQVPHNSAIVCYPNGQVKPF